MKLYLNPDILRTDNRNADMVFNAYDLKKTKYYLTKKEYKKWIRYKRPQTKLFKFKIKFSRLRRKIKWYLLEGKKYKEGI